MTVYPIASPRRISVEWRSLRLRLTPMPKTIPTFAKFCDHCGGEYRATGTAQKYCPRCAPTDFFVRLIREYKINRPLFEATLTQQGWACALCREEFPGGPRSYLDRNPRPILDHDHITRKPRSILCTGCNTRLGNGMDEERWLALALAYVRCHRAGRRWPEAAAAAESSRVIVPVVAELVVPDVAIDLAPPSARTRALLRACDRPGFFLARAIVDDESDDERSAA